MWFLEYVFRSYYIDLRWPLVCIGLEHLIHTDRYNSTKQFSSRVSILAEELGVSGFYEKKAREAYALRSTLVHGQRLRDLEEYEVELYEEIEGILRGAIKKAILDYSFARIFESDDAIKERWPLS